MQGSENRTNPRTPLQKEVVINDKIHAYALDVSEGGMYISTPEAFSPGARLDVSFEFEGSFVKMGVVVQHVQPGIGMGVKFTDASPALNMLIKKFINHAKGLYSMDSKKKVLIADSSMQSRTMYKNKLNMDGFTILEAADGLEALRIMQESRPDLVILDLMLKGLHGFKILQMMQLNPLLKDVPVIVLSALNIEGEIKKAITFGAKEFLPKMMTTPVKLAEKVKEILYKVR